MPIYEFICQKCGHKFETFVSLGKESQVACNSCRSPDIKKLFSSFGIGGGSNRLQSASASCNSCSSRSCSTCR